MEAEAPNGKDVGIFEVRETLEQYGKIVNQIEGFQPGEQNTLEKLERAIEDKRRVVEENKAAKMKHIGKVEATIGVLEERIESQAE